MYFDWLNNIEDWNISRQIVWGPRIPAWYCLDCNKNIELSFLDTDKQKIHGRYKDVAEKHSFEEIQSGLQSLTAPVDAIYALDAHLCTSTAEDTRVTGNRYV